MIRLHITVEGQTEERFVKETLSPYLGRLGVFTDARCVLTGRDKKKMIAYRGGFKRHAAYVTVKKDIMNWIKEDKRPECRFSTMFDFYALPEDFPGQTECSSTADKYKKVKILEDALRSDINDSRFIPYIQLHEFEALIFSDPYSLCCEYLDHDSAINLLVKMAQEQQNPELINDGVDTAPSKRIINAIPEHEGNKTAGALIVARIGIHNLKNKCRHFNEWLTSLESLNI